MYLVGTISGILIYGVGLIIFFYMSKIFMPEDIGPLSVIVFVSFVSLCTIYGLALFVLMLNLSDRFMRDDVFDKEPKFIQKFSWKVYNTSSKLLKDAKRSDGEIQTIKRKKKEDKAGKKAIKMAKKRQEEEEKRMELDVIHSRSEILDIWENRLWI